MATHPVLPDPTCFTHQTLALLIMLCPHVPGSALTFEFGVIKENWLIGMRNAMSDCTIFICVWSTASEEADSSNGRRGAKSVEAEPEMAIKMPHLLPAPVS